MSQTLVFLRGQHSTLIKGKDPHEIEELIREKEDDQGRERFVSLRNDYHSPHKSSPVYLDPTAIVGFVQTG